MQRGSWRGRGLLAMAGLGAAAAALLSFALYRLLFVYPYHDQSWYLYAAGRVLAGTQLYGPQLTETNPPLIIWFSMLPNVVGRWLHASPLLGLQIVVGAMVLASTLWVLKLLRAAGLVQGWAAALVGFAEVLAVEASTTPVEFGQREQLVVLLLLPYIVAAVSSAATGAGRLQKILLGVAAGVGLCFKPQQVLVLIGLELALTLYCRSVRRLVRTELVALVATGAAYLAVVKLAAPLYLQNTVPVLRDTYWAYGQIPAARLFGYQLHFNLMLVAVFAVWLWRRPTLLAPAAPFGLLACSLCASLAFYIQHAGWSYQGVPQRAFLYFAIAWLALDTVRVGLAGRVFGRGQRQGFVAAAVVALAVLAPVLVRHGERNLAEADANRDKSYVQQVISQYPAGTPVYMLSTSLDHFRYVYEDRMEWSSRYAHLWMLPAIVLNERAEAGGPAAKKTLAPARVQQLAQLQRETLAEDLRTRRPVVVLVERCTPEHECQALPGMSFDALAWFGRSPAFAAEWAHYQRQQGDAQYDVYVRLD